MSKLEISIYDKNEVATYKPLKTWTKKPILIRIMDDENWTRYPRLQYEKCYKAIHKVSFLDVEVEPDDKKRQDIYKDELLTDDKIQGILDFLNQFEPSKISEVVIHCSSGRRRSVALGAFIAKYLIEDNALYYRISHIYSDDENVDDVGNPVIYKQLVKYYENHEI